MTRLLHGLTTLYTGDTAVMRRQPRQPTKAQQKSNWEEAIYTWRKTGRNKLQYCVKVVLRQEPIKQDRNSGQLLCPCWDSSALWNVKNRKCLRDHPSQRLMIKCSVDNNPERIGIWKCWFLRRGENRNTRRKTSRSKEENQQQVNPHMTSGPGIRIEPGTHWWEASATNAPTLLLCVAKIFNASPRANAHKLQSGPFTTYQVLYFEPTCSPKHALPQHLFRGARRQSVSVYRTRSLTISRFSWKK